MKLKTCLPKTRTLQRSESHCFAAFEGIGTDPELKLKRVIAGRAQNKIFPPPVVSTGFEALQESGKKNEKNIFFYKIESCYGERREEVQDRVKIQGE